MTVKILVCMAAGVFAGAFSGRMGFVPDLSQLTQVLMFFLVFAVGVELGLMVRKMGPYWLLGQLVKAVPIICGTVVGTLLGGIAAAPILGMEFAHSLAVACGFGWYSLSSVLLAGFGGPALGAMAFLANIFREAAAFLLIPQLRRLGWRAGAVASAGATSMDTTLPAITASFGAENAPIALAHGLTITFLVPIAIPLVCKLPF